MYIKKIYETYNRSKRKLFFCKYSLFFYKYHRASKTSISIHNPPVSCSCSLIPLTLKTHNPLDMYIKKITKRTTGAKGNYFLQVLTIFYKYHRASKTSISTHNPPVSCSCSLIPLTLKNTQPT